MLKTVQDVEVLFHAQSFSFTDIYSNEIHELIHDAPQCTLPPTEPATSSPVQLVPVRH